MPPAPRGSAAFSAKQLLELRKVAETNGRLVYWYQKGQPVPDAIAGAVIAPKDKVGGAIEVLLGVRGVNPRLDVFPLGIPFPEEFLVNFEEGFRGGAG
jgi:hypothetical protein